MQQRLRVFQKADMAFPEHQVAALQAVSIRVDDPAQAGCLLVGIPR
jgi:hypothetical protein